MLLALEITCLDFTSFLLLGNNLSIGFSIISAMVWVKTRLFCACRIILVILVTDGIVAAYGREETKMLPDIVTYLQSDTSLTRRTLVDILKSSGTLYMVKKNPQRYMEDVSKIITANMKAMLVDGIKYTKLGDDEFYAQELFESEELQGYLNQNMIPSNRSVYEYVVFDSGLHHAYTSSPTSS